MDNVLISVIIPVYNVEKYLERCIASILNQSYKNIEILLLDDGSSDNSSSICEDYRKKDKRIHYYRHNNQGVSFTRNNGIHLSQGEWICFVDSDDSLEENYVLELVEDMNSQKGCELVIHGIRILDSLTKKQFIVKPNKKRLFCFGADANFLSDVPVLCLASPISKLFKKSIIINNSIKFDERISIGEDYLFTIEYLNYISSVAINKSANYNYFRSQGSLSTTYSTFHSEVLAENMLYKSTMKLGTKLNIDCNEINLFYNIQFKKHAYRILFSLYKNRFTVYSKKERIALLNSLNKEQLERIKNMFLLNGFFGKIISYLFTPKMFFVSDVLFKFLVNNKIK